MRFVEVPEVGLARERPAVGRIRFRLRRAARPDRDIERNPRFEVLGSTITNHPPDGLRQDHPQLRNPLVRRALTHAIDRQAIVDALWAGRTRDPARPAVGILRRRCSMADWAVRAFDPAEARRLLREAGYRGDPIPYRLLNNYYTNQVADAQVLVEMWRAGRAERADRDEGELAARSSTATASRARARLVEQRRCSTTPSPPSSRGFGPQRQKPAGRRMAQRGIQPPCRSSWRPAPTARAAAWRSARMLEIAEREDPAYTVLHQTATFTAKRRDIRWQAAQCLRDGFPRARTGELTMPRSV